MDMNDYQQWTELTKKYPESFNVYYPAMELGGESGEVLNQVKKIARDDNNIVTEERRDALSKELGDVLWALARQGQGKKGGSSLVEPCMLQHYSF